MGFIDRWLGLEPDDAKEKDLQREADTEHIFTGRTDEEWREMEQFEAGEIDRWGHEVDEDTDPADLYHEPE